MLKKRQVAITGIGLVSPVGNDTDTCWKNLLKGQSGLSLFEHESLKDYPYKFVGQVKGEQDLLNKVFDSNKQRKTDRFIHLSVLAGHQAMVDAGFSKEFPQDRFKFGVSVGIGIGGVNMITQSSIDFYTGGVKKISPFLIPRALSNLAADWLSMEWGLYGQAYAIVNACSSSGDSIGHAFRQISDGYVDYMLAGGTESCICPLGLAAFGNMRALSSWKGDASGSSRPFDKDRSGFVMSEGAAFLVLEELELAKKRGANIYALITGYGATCDGYHITAMHPEGLGACKAIEFALQDSGINPEQIGYINAHGTGTPMNDKVETLVLKKVFGQHILPKNKGHILVSSSKSMTGHLLGAAGGLEISISALALKNQVVTPTINLDNPDPECDLDYVSKISREHKFDYALSNSFGFGGGNSIVVLKRFC